MHQRNSEHTRRVLRRNLHASGNFSFARCRDECLRSFENSRLNVENSRSNFRKWRNSYHITQICYESSITNLTVSLDCFMSLTEIGQNNRQTKICVRKMSFSLIRHNIFLLCDFSNILSKTIISIFSSL